MKLDDALQNTDFKFISLLSIDVEGQNVEVLRGAASSANHSLLVCLRFDQDEEKQTFATLLGNDFKSMGR